MQKFHVIGLMSGTSCDGLDIAFASFVKSKQHWQYELHQADTIAYSPGMVQTLKSAKNLSATELLQLNIELGMFFGEQVAKFMKKHKLKPDFVASHGHTVFHQPEQGYTYQIGDPHRIHALTGLRVYADFRSLDVAFGGQGAPLVPIGDQLLFAEYDYCLNIGGIANISMEHDGQRIAFDIGVANLMLNYLAGLIELPMDMGGAMAQSGRIIPDWLDTLHALDYYQKPHPKSLGVEWWHERMLPSIPHASIEDLLHTYSHHLAIQIAEVVKKYPAKRTSSATLLVTGGGAHNAFLMQLIAQYSKGFATIHLPDHQLIDFKEALIFAFIGTLRHLGQPNCLKSVTGAISNVCGGIAVG
jgi:anhydro-N-acetylmuramic acid kinase